MQDELMLSSMVIHTIYRAPAMPPLLLLLVQQMINGGEGSGGPPSSQPFELHAADSLTQVILQLT
jgi:hypothetical protein